ncbi:MAG: ATP-binding protein [Bryobacter sp.]|nr:ATP-binding protein [Bryobacter sp.]
MTEVSISPKKIVVPGIFLLGIVISLASGWRLALLEKQSVDQEIDAAAVNRISAFERELQSEEAKLQLLAAYVETSGTIDAPALSLYLEKFQASTGTSTEYFWLPSSGSPERQVFTGAGRKPWVPEVQQTEEFRGALARARQQKGMTISQRLERAEWDYPVFLLQAVYRAGKARGVVGSVFSARDVMEKAFQRLRPSGIDAYIFDMKATAERSLLAFHRSRRSSRTSKVTAALPRPEQWPKHHKEARIAGRAWMIVCEPIAELQQVQLSLGSAGIMVAGILISTLGAILMRRGENQREKIEGLVQQRTRELAEARDVAVEASAMKSRFVANVSHELRTPLNGILTANNLLRSTELTAEQVDLCETILASGQTLRSLVEDLLDIAQVEAGTLKIMAEPFRLDQLVEDCVRVAALEAAARDLELKHEISTDLQVWQLGDANRIRQVLFNFLSNALKFTERGGITLSVEKHSKRQADWIWFSVRDTGCGISQDQQKRIFGRFVQADASSTRRVRGVGLGLSIAKEIVGRMGGEIGFSSQAGVGSEFWFEIPERALPAQQIPEANDTPEQQLLLAGLRVLLAEDNPINQKLAQRLLERAGCRVWVAGDGEKAVKAAQAEKFDLILMDLQMPKMDGFEAARAIRKHQGPNAATPILAFSANATAEDIRATQIAGMNGHIAKPLALEQLREQIRQCLETKVG